MSLAERPIAHLPLPRALALPFAPDAALQAKAGETVCAGAVLAVGGSGADVLAPLGGRVAGIVRRPLAAGGDAACVLLRELSPRPPLPLRAATLPALLKRAGVVGLGGGGFPAWRKWRRGLRWLVANGLETEEGAQHDAALIARCGDALVAQVALVARAFAAAPLLALPPQAPLAAHPCIRRLPPQYALGSERLLVQEVCGLRVPPPAVPADYGAACFNIATVLAMAAALRHGTPQTQRLLSVHAADGGLTLLRLPFGASVGDVRRFVRAPASAAARAGGADEAQPAADEAVLTAATAVLRFDAPRPRPALPCIRCGDCLPVCPEQLSPLRLHQLAQDAYWDAMREERLQDCLACRRCDEVCPSSLPLTATFIAAGKQLAARQARQAQEQHRRRRFERHSARLAAPPPRIGRAALHRHVQAAVAKAQAAEGDEAAHCRQTRGGRV